MDIPILRIRDKETGNWQEITAIKGTDGIDGVSGFQEYVHTKVGTVHQLEGPVNNNIKFTATASFVSGDTFTVNGVSCTGINSSGNPLDDDTFVTGVVISCFLNGTVLNFKTGGVQKQKHVAVVTSSQTFTVPKDVSLVFVRLFGGGGGGGYFSSLAGGGGIIWQYLM